MKWAWMTLWGLLAGSIASLYAGGEKGNLEAWERLAAGKAGNPVEVRKDLARATNVDEEDAAHGKTALVQRVTDPDRQQALGLGIRDVVAGTPLTWDWSVHFWLKLSENPEPKAWPLTLYDTEGDRAVIPLGNRPADNQWHEFSLPLSVFQRESGFDLQKLATLQLEAQLPKGTAMKLDDVYFYHPIEQTKIRVAE